MPLIDLANELILFVAENLSTLSDLNGFAQTSKRLYFLLNDYLYRIDVQRDGSSALLWAAEHGLEKTAELSLAEGADCEATGRDTPRSTDIPLRVSYRRRPIRKFHFDEQSSTITQPFTSLTPLQLAVDHKHEFVARLLIEHGADVRKAYPVRMAKCTPLHLASANGLTATVQLLLDKGAKLEAKNEQGQTPLHYAVKPNRNRPRGRGNIKTVICLLENGARYGTRDRSGRRPEDLVKTTRWSSEQEQEEDGRAEKRIKQLLEAKEAQRIVEKWDRDRESSRKKRIAAEKVLRERVANRKRERPINDCFREEAQGKEMKEEVQKIAEEIEATGNRAEEARVLDISVRERQDAARKNWSQLREQAEQRARVLGTCSAIVSSSCAHSSIGWLRNKARAQCQLCEKICTKYSFQCPDCRSVACMRCKLQHS
jgi:ankyrin repeat protein